MSNSLFSGIIQSKLKIKLLLRFFLNPDTRAYLRQLSIDNYHLHDLTKKTERYIKRKIRHLVLTRSEFEAFEKDLAARPHLLIWER
jgi:hypothetical protein